MRMFTAKINIDSEAWKELRTIVSEAKGSRANNNDLFEFVREKVNHDINSYIVNYYETPLSEEEVESNV